MDHYHPRENPVRSFGRIAVMVLVSLLTLTIGGGGYTDLNAFGFVGYVLGSAAHRPHDVVPLSRQAFWPLVRYPIALIGLFPLLLVIYFGAKGDVIYMRVIILSSLAWSAAWLERRVFFGARRAKKLRKHLET